MALPVPKGFIGTAAVMMTEKRNVTLQLDCHASAWGALLRMGGGVLNWSDLASSLATPPVAGGCEQKVNLRMKQSRSSTSCASHLKQCIGRRVRAANVAIGPGRCCGVFLGRVRADKYAVPPRHYPTCHGRWSSKPPSGYLSVLVLL